MVLRYLLIYARTHTLLCIYNKPQGSEEKENVALEVFSFDTITFIKFEFSSTQQKTLGQFLVLLPLLAGLQ